MNHKAVEPPPPPDFAPPLPLVPPVGVVGVAGVAGALGAGVAGASVTEPGVTDVCAELLEVSNSNSPALVVAKISVAAFSEIAMLTTI